MWERKQGSGLLFQKLKRLAIGRPLSPPQAPSPLQRCSVLLDPSLFCLLEEQVSPTKALSFRSSLEAVPLASREVPTAPPGLQPHMAALWAHV